MREGDCQQRNEIVLERLIYKKSFQLQMERQRTHPISNLFFSNSNLILNRGFCCKTFFHVKLCFCVVSQCVYVIVLLIGSSANCVHWLIFLSKYQRCKLVRLQLLKYSVLVQYNQGRLGAYPIVTDDSVSVSLQCSTIWVLGLLGWRERQTRQLITKKKIIQVLLAQTHQLTSSEEIFVFI